MSKIRNVDRNGVTAVAGIVRDSGSGPSGVEAGSGRKETTNP